MSNIIQTIFRDHGNNYIASCRNGISERDYKVIKAVCECRTGLRGIHLFECPECHYMEFANSSCGNRHCPGCQHQKAVEWVYKRELSVLPCNYFLATFTLPEELRETAYRNQKIVYTALFKCASASLKVLEADPRFVGCKTPGFFGVLQTWTRQMLYHPHVHFVIPGGGLSEKRDKWISAKNNFLVHVKALSSIFKAKMRDEFIKAGIADNISPKVWENDWVVHCKSVGDGRAVIKYLGSYVFNVAISNSRILNYDGENVTFSYKKTNSNRIRKMTLSAIEFIRRFLLHVLPHGFMKIRYYGFLSANCKVPIQKIRELICRLYELLRDIPMATPPKSKPKICPRCKNIMQWKEFVVLPFRTRYIDPVFSFSSA